MQDWSSSKNPLSEIQITGLAGKGASLVVPAQNDGNYIN
jgi:hypothetical protein